MAIFKNTPALRGQSNRHLSKCLEPVEANGLCIGGVAAWDLHNTNKRVQFAACS